MKIRLTDIPQRGLTIDDSISVDDLNARMNTSAGNDIEFLFDPQVHAEIHLERDSAESGATATGSILVEYQQPCPRCLEPLQRKIHEHFNVIFKPRPDSGVDKDNDDLGLVYFDGEHIDLEDLIQETLILAVSPFGFPHENCHGVKAVEDSRGSSTNLGELLRSAGLQQQNKK